MEEQFKNEDRIIRKLVSEAGLEKPSTGFQSKLMQIIEQKSLAKTSYTPLISSRGWWILALLAIGFFAIIFLAPIDINASSLDLGLNRIGEMIPEFKVSSAFLYGTMFLVLFILQIPLLKKYMDGQLE